jgi:ATP-dependent Clp protease ATP-binding subunit ClpA
MAPEVFSYIAKEGYSSQYGARPLKRLIQDKILTPVASFMLTQGLNRGGTISVSMKGNEFIFDAKKGKKSPIKTHAIKKEEEKVEK